MKATQQLKDEHEGIKLMLKIIENISNDLKNDKELNIEHYGQIIEFIKGFADKCHHGKEEDILFPAMVHHGIPNEGGPIAVMLDEHQMGRNHIKSLSRFFEDFKAGNKKATLGIISSSLAYVQLLRNHIEKENNILFMMADKVLNEAEQSEIFEEFEKLEVEKIGIGKHEEYHHLLKELKTIYLQ
jgi:hemerythrin-like domain-containing protein